MIEYFNVHIICHDGIEYDRVSTADEIDSMRKLGYVIGDGYDNVTFNFREYERV